MSTAVGIGILRDAYPRAEFPDRSVAAYAEMLADLDDQAVVEAVRRLILRSPFLPAISEIRREVAEMRLALPSSVEAWEMVASQDGPSVLHLPDEVAEALKSMGGKYALRHSTEPGIFRSQFVKIYEGLREHALLVEMGAVGVRELPSPTMRSLPVSSAIRPGEV